MRSGDFFCFLFLLSLNTALALGVVFGSWQSRGLYRELQSAERERMALEVRWRRLSLEESSVHSYALVETAARGQLGMREPGAGEIVAVHWRKGK